MSDTTKDHVENAVESHTDLNIFQSIIAILEGGTLSPKSYKTAEQIIKICQRQQQKLLTSYDKAVEKVVVKPKQTKAYVE